MARFAKIQEETGGVSGIGDSYTLGHHDDIAYAYKAGKGLSEEVVKNLSGQKGEPEWMLKYRLEALARYRQMPIPLWGGNIGEIKFDDIYYYLRPLKKEAKSWDDVPAEIKKTFDRIGVPEAEKEMLAGVKGQFDSEVIYGSLKESLRKKGVVFLSMDEGLKEFPEIVKEYFGKVIPMGDNKLAALNSAVWSGGSFVYIPKGVEVGLPLQAYFRINSENAGQFERTLIVAEEGSKVHYVEGCSAPSYSSGSLHSAVVEIVVKKGARVQYTTVQNWYRNVYNLVTKRARVEEEAEMRWIDGNLGCVVGETLVSVPTGYRKIEELKKGDVIYAFDLNELKPRKREVVEMKMMGEKQTYKLITSDYKEVLATGNHPFLRLKKRIGSSIYELQWVNLNQLKQGDLIAVMSAYPDEGKTKKMRVAGLDGYRLVNIPKLPDYSDEDLMWFLGAYLGDGCLERATTQVGVKGRRVNFAIPDGDKAHVRIVEILNKWKIQWTQYGVTKRINSTYLAELVRQLGFEGLAKTKTVPGWIFGLPLRQKLSFIEGYLDTDGHIRKKKVKEGREYGQLTFACANKRLLEDMRNLMITCGLEPKKVTTYLKERKLYKGVLKEYITHYMSMNLGGNLDLIRNKEFKGNYMRFVKVREIQEGKVAKVYDIEVGGSHNFVANGIIVHNSKLTMKYPSCLLVGRKAKGETLSIAMAGAGQHQDAGAKMVHLAPETTSQIISKSISKGGGRATYRGLVQINKGAVNSRSKVVCDALILDDRSRSDTYPTNRILENQVTLEHEATVSKVGEEQLFYLMSRGLPEHEAEAMIVNGFLEPIMKQIPLEYAVEMNRLVELEMEGSVG